MRALTFVNSAGPLGPGRGPVRLGVVAEVCGVCAVVVFVDGRAHMRALSLPLSFTPSLPLSSLARLLPHFVPAALTRSLCERECVGGWGVDECVCMCLRAVAYWGSSSTTAAMISFQRSTYHPFSRLPPATIAKLRLAPRFAGVWNA